MVLTVYLLTHVQCCMEPSTSQLKNQLQQTLNTQYTQENLYQLTRTLSAPSKCCTRHKSSSCASVVECVRYDGNNHNSHHCSQPTVHNRSYCPWFYNNNTDYNRFPTTLLEASCSCALCQGQGHAHGNHCQEVFTAVTVLYKNGQSQHGTCLYEKRKLVLAMGCTCVRGSTT